MNFNKERFEVGNITNPIKDTGEKAGKGFSDFGGTLKDGFSDFGNILKDGFGDIGDFFNDVFGDIGDILKWLSCFGFLILCMCCLSMLSPVIMPMMMLGSITSSGKI